MYNDPACYIALKCSSMSILRELLWCDIINNNDIMFSVYFHSLPDPDLFHILISGPVACNLENANIKFTFLSFMSNIPDYQLYECFKTLLTITFLLLFNLSLNS